MDTRSLIIMICAMAILAALVIVFLFHHLRHREKKFKTKVIFLASSTVVVIGYLIVLLFSGVINVTGTVVEPSKGLTAIDYVNAFKNAGLPIENIIEYNEKNDENSLLGRPGQYISKVNFADTRLEQYDETDPTGGTVEVFNSSSDLQDRKSYIETVQETVGAMLAQYIFVSKDGLALVRIEFDLPSDQAAEYEDVLLNIDQYLLSPGETGIHPSSPKQTAKNANPSESSMADSKDASSAAAGQTEPDFRNASWGMSVKDVIESEDSQPYKKSADSLIYLRKDLSGLSSDLYYTFDNGRLISGLYSINCIRTHLNDNIDDYNRLKQELVSKYGDPLTDELYWIDDSYQDDPDNYGLAISLGALEYFSQWNVDDSDIVMLMSGNNNDISLTILYRSNESIAASNSANTDGL